MTDTSVTEIYIPDPLITEILENIDEMAEQGSENYEELRSLGWEPTSFYVDSVGIQVEMEKN